MQWDRRIIALILSPFGVLLLSAARLLIVSDYSTTTAVTIASSGGYLNTLLGSIIPLLPIFLPYLALSLLLFRRFFISVLVFVFAAFMTPTSITFSDILHLARADWYQLLGKLSSNIWTILVIAALCIFLLWAYHKSLMDALSAVFVMAVGAVLLTFSSPNPGPSIPVQLRLASSQEHQLVVLASANRLLTIAVVSAVVLLLLFYRGFPGTLSSIAALFSTIVLAIYVYAVYPLPNQSSYYAQISHQLWLPAETIAATSGKVYAGYVLANDSDWFTVLLASSRTVVYIPTGDVSARSVCQPARANPLKQYPPLIPLLYNPPPNIPGCGRLDASTALISIVSDGQSLRDISSITHTSPWRIISITNAYQHEILSAALRAYESAHDWNEPTPVGQRFWYYPSTTP